MAAAGQFGFQLLAPIAALRGQVREHARAEEEAARRKLRKKPQQQAVTVLKVTETQFMFLQRVAQAVDLTANGPFLVTVQAI